VRILYIDYPVV